MIYLTLFMEFFKIGLFSIGGGLATLPFLYQLADKYTWFTKEMLIDMIAVSESTPGPIGINMATYAGYSASGILGGVVATLAIITPSVFILGFVVRILDVFSENRFVKASFYGLRPAVTALIASAFIGIFMITVINLPAFKETGNVINFVNYKQFALFLALLFATNKWSKYHPIIFIGISAIVGIIFKF